MTELVVETQSLVKCYGRNAAVNGLSMAVPRGAVYGLLGRNGAGKTTTIRLLAGLARPAAGEATILGLNPERDRLAVLSRTGFVIEKMLLPSMTGDDLARYNSRFFPEWSAALAKKYAELLEVPMNLSFRKLSHGNRTKLCLLLAMAQDPELLVLDEPTMGLDPAVTDQLLRLLIEDFASSGRTILISSNHLSEVEKIADWVGIIESGRMLLQAQLDDIRANYARVRASGSGLPLQAPDVVTVSETGGVCEYVVRSGAEGFTAELRRQGAIMLDTSPMNLSELFLELVGKENRDAMEVLA
jgi:ABC-2 type transport system ATP-binding protein